MRASHVRHMKSKRIFNQSKAELDDRRKMSKKKGRWPSLAAKA